MAEAAKREVEAAKREVEAAEKKVEAAKREVEAARANTKMTEMEIQLIFEWYQVIVLQFKDSQEGVSNAREGLKAAQLLPPLHHLYWRKRCCRSQVFLIFIGDPFSHLLFYQ